MRPRLAAVALALAASHVAGPAAAAGCAAVTKAGRWTSIALPPGTTADYVEVVPTTSRSRPDVLVLMTGRVMLRSTDGGCTWKETFSLDKNLPETSPARANPNVRLVSAAVSGGRTVVAVAIDALGSVAVTPPVMTIASTDGGVRWQAREPGPADLADAPRCSASAVVEGSPDPKVAYLMCPTNSLGEVFLSLFGPICRSIVYVTADSGATWRATTGRFTDPAKVTPENPSGCSPFTNASSNFAVADDAASRVLWRVGPCELALYRAAEDGAKPEVWATLPRVSQYCRANVVAGRLKAGTTAAVCQTNGFFVSSRRGSFAEAPPVPLKASELGVVTGCVLDPAANRLLAFYVDGAKRARVFGYDVRRRSWHSVFVAPTPKSGPPWGESTYVTGVLSPVPRALYVRAYGQTLYRLAL